MGKLLRTISHDGSVICTVLDSTDIVSELEKIHHSSATITAAIGRLVTASSMMGSMLKNDADSITVRMSGSGPAGSLIAVSDWNGNPRGYVANPIVEIPLNQYGKLDVAGAIGKSGMLSVIKDVGLPEVSTGSVAIVSGEVAEDITNYYASSEQTPTVCALGVLVNTDLSVRVAGGYLLQLLPGADEETISRVEANIKDIRPVTELLDKGLNSEKIMEILMSGFSPEPMYETMAEYRCNCSKGRVERALISIGREELEKLAKEQENTEVECHFCDRKYSFSSEELLELLKN